MVDLLKKGVHRHWRLQPISDEYHLYSRNQLLHILAQERARADRNEQPFSLAVFDLTSLQQNHGHLKRFVKTVARRARLTDHLGWLNKRTVGVVLPETCAKGAWKLVDEVCDKLGASPSRPDCTVYAYPNQALPRILDDGTPGRGTSFEPPANSTETPPGLDGDSAGGLDQPNGRLATHTSSEMRLEPLLIQPMTAWKRALDIVGATVALIVFSPLFVVISLLIKLSSAGPILYRQTRLGYLGKPFTFLKFRTMQAGAEKEVHSEYLKALIDENKPMTKLDQRQDPRIFPLGRILRQTCLDELPQLFNVLRGDMSLVGPRPCLPYEAQHFQRWQRRRFDCVPGMTGLWQVSGKNETTFKDMIRMDIAYASKRSFFLDLKILLKTISLVVKETRLTLRGTDKTHSQGELT